MSSDIAIEIKNLSKCYQIYSKPQDRLKQSIFTNLRSIFGKPSKHYFKEFWAVKDISIKIKRGETLGIIGRNGSGKSTLLQLICGTLNQTEGSVKTYGRVAALLELGSGFNPEFTGRDNVYLNATVLGLSSTEIDERFAKIEEFADIGEFIDQPVKTYSSGMFVRLAFAVIAHVDADILIVDEALAVGDAIFTQKCMRFIRKFQEKGTLLFVSHDTASVQNLCEKAIWLSQGTVRMVGPSKKVTESYLQDNLQQIYGPSVELKNIEIEDNISKFIPLEFSHQELESPDASFSLVLEDNLNSASGWKTGTAEIQNISLEKLGGSAILTFEGGEHVRFTVQAKANEFLENPIIGFVWRDRLGQDLFGENTLPYTANIPISIQAGQTMKAFFKFQIPMLPNGQYSINVALADGDLHDHIQHHWLNDALIITVSSSKVRWGLVGIQFEEVRLEVEK